MFKLQWGERSFPSALDDASRKTHRGLEWPMCVISGLTAVLTPWPWTTKVCTRNPTADTHSSSARKGMAHLCECVWKCKDLKGVTPLSPPWQYSQVLPSGIDRAKPSFWAGLTLKCVFQIQHWHFLRRHQFSQLRWTLVSILQYLSFSFTKGRVLKQYHMALEKSWGVTGGKWGAWSCREDICAQRCVKFHKTRCNP